MRNEAPPPLPHPLELQPSDHPIEGCQIIGFDWHYLYVNRVVTQPWRPQLRDRATRECDDLSITHLLLMHLKHEYADKGLIRKWEFCNSGMRNGNFEVERMSWYRVAMPQI
jgi:hypothetical protein